MGSKKENARKCSARFHYETKSGPSYFEGSSQPLGAWGMGVNGAAQACSQREVGDK